MESFVHVSDVPEGHYYFNQAIDSVNSANTPAAKANLAAAFRDKNNWINATHDLLLQYGLHATGAWSDVEAIRHATAQGPTPLAYKVILDAMANYGRKRGGIYADAISVNYYFAWTPDFDVLANWEKAANKPILISEWYAKGMDTGLTNRTGAGWRVDTQAQRGAFYENFSLALLQSKNVIGWQWFKYQDNDPNDPNAEASNVDSNKGIVDSHYKPYRPLLESMKRINDNSYALADYFDKRKD